MNKSLTHTYALPATWVSALFNGDVTGLNDDDIGDILDFFKTHKPGKCITASNNEIGAGLLEYTFSHGVMDVCELEKADWQAEQLNEIFGD